MCRRTTMQKTILFSFGTGILLGACLEGGICCVLLGVSSIAAGLFLCQCH